MITPEKAKERQAEFEKLLVQVKEKSLKEAERVIDLELGHGRYEVKIPSDRDLHVELLRRYREQGTWLIEVMKKTWVFSEAPAVATPEPGPAPRCEPGKALGSAFRDGHSDLVVKTDPPTTLWKRLLAFVRRMVFRSANDVTA